MTVACKTSEVKIGAYHVLEALSVRSDAHAVTVVRTCSLIMSLSVNKTPRIFSDVTRTMTGGGLIFCLRHL